MTVVDRGITEVSSSYSRITLRVLQNKGFEHRILDLPSLVSSELIMSSKSDLSPSRFMVMISLFRSKTDIPVPSKATRDGSFCDLKRKKTEEDMVAAESTEALRDDLDK